MRTLLLDIETSPSLAYVWGLWDQTVSLKQLEATTEVLCFAAKFIGERKMHFYSEHADGHENMVGAAWELLTEADAVVTYNGDRFDLQHLNREFLLMGLKPPSPYKSIDLFKAVKRRFRFVSNKLEHVVEQLGIGSKVKHEGFELWKACMAGDEAAWRRMERYNKQDVKLLEPLYNELLPWIPQHPNRRLFDGADPDGCPTCGGVNLQRRGFAVTQVSKFQRWQCQDCGAWFRTARRESGSDLQGVVL